MDHHRTKFIHCNRLVSFTGCFVLTVMVVILLTACLVESFKLSRPYPVVLSSLVILGPALLVKRRKIRPEIMASIGEAGWTRRDLAGFAAVIMGGVLTFNLANGFGLGAVMASSLVGVVAALVLPGYSVPLFCGSFTGMACLTVLTGYPQILLASTLAGGLFVMTKYTFIGFGGKLGTIAFAGCLGAAWLTGQPLASAPVPDWGVGGFLLLYSVLGALITYILNIRCQRSPVFSSGIVGLSAGLILPIVHPVNGATYAIMAFCSSFAGMSSQKRVNNELAVIFVGVLCALIYIYSSQFFGGAGGKLGTIAFSSVIISVILRFLLTRYKKDGNLPESNCRSQVPGLQKTLGSSRNYVKSGKPGIKHMSNC